MMQSPSEESTKQRPKTSDLLTAGFYTKFLRGAALALSAFRIATVNPKLRKELKKAWKVTLYGAVATLAVTFVVFLLLHLPLRLLNLFGDFQSALEATSPASILGHLSVLLTLITSDVLTAFWHAPAREIFFATLALEAPDLAKSLEARKQALSFDLTIRIKRYARLLGYALVLRLLGLLPVVGSFASPLQLFLVLSPKLGPRVSIAIAAAGLLPILRPISEPFIQSWLAAMSLGQDAVWEYYSRLPTSEMRKYFLRRYQGALTGLGLVYSACMAVPFLGLAAFFLAQAGGALLVVDILRRNQSKTRKVDLLDEKLVSATG